MSRRLILVGGGEHARVVGEAARSGSEPWLLMGYVDRAPVPTTDALLDIPFLGDDDALVEHAAAPEASRPWVILGMGSGDRAGIESRIARLGLRWATVVHSTAWVSPSATIGEGAAVLAGAVVNTGAAVGAHAIVNTAAVVDHDVVVGEFAHVAPGACLGGGVVLGARSFVGLGAAIRDHVRVGDGAIVGMGSVVVDEVGAGVVVRGVPARPVTEGSVS